MQTILAEIQFCVAFYKREIDVRIKFLSARLYIAVHPRGTNMSQLGFCCESKKYRDRGGGGAGRDVALPLLLRGFIF